MILITTISCNGISNQEEIPDGIIFERLIGPPSEHSQELFTSFSLLADGGYIITGSTGGIGFGQEDILLMKVTAAGNISWIKTFGVPEQFEMGRKVIVTEDGGYLVIGNTFSKGAGNSDMYLIKTDREGNLLWDKTYGTAGGEDGFDILATDNGYYLLGNMVDVQTTYNDFFLVRTDLQGNMQWNRKYGTDTEDIAETIIQLSDGSLVLGGYTRSGVDFVDIYLINVAGDGVMRWEKRFDGPETDLASGDVVGGMKPTPDGGLIVAGTQSVNALLGFSGRAWLIKLSGNGTMQWQRTFGELGGVDARGEAVEVLEDGYLMVGTKLRLQETDYYLVRTDLQGNLVWEHSLHHSSSDEGLDIVRSDQDIFTIGGNGYELDFAQQIYLMSFKNRPDR